MNRLDLAVRAGRLDFLAERQWLFAGSAYEVSVDALEFATDGTSEATLQFATSSEVCASCSLVPDPLRRGLRTGVVHLPVYEESVDLDVRVELAGSTLAIAGVRVTGLPGGTAAPSGDAQPRWTVVDLGRVDTGTISLADMTQVKMVASPVGAPLNIAVVDGLMDAYVLITTDGARGFPYTGVLIDNSAPSWVHQDSFGAPSQTWMLHVTRVAGRYFADLRAGLPAGVETDPDGAVIISAEVNN